MKFFDKWDTAGIVVQDPGLKNYISLQPRLVPKTGARYAGFRFHKSKISIVERLVNKMMVSGHRNKKHKRSSGHNTGKAITNLNILKKALEMIEEKLQTNPIGVLVKAIENASPREEIVSIEYGGARYPRAVECAPQRRIDIALRNIAQGAYAKAFNGKKSASQTLADEIIAAYRLQQISNSISKKYDLERQAHASR